MIPGLTKKILYFQITTLLLITFSTSTLSGAGRNNYWHRAFNEYDFYEYSIKVTRDGYLICGEIDGQGYGDDLVIIKLNQKGEQIWVKEFNHPKYAGASSIDETENGYVIAGFTSSKGRGARDAWIIFLAKNGTVIWDKTFGEYRDDYATGVKAIDNGFITVGHTYNRSKSWLARLSDSGNAIWEHNKKLAVHTTGLFMTVINNTIILAGQSRDSDNTIVILGYDLDGQPTWSKKIVYDRLYALKDHKKGYAMLLATNDPLSGQRRFSVLYLDNKGSIVWQRDLKKIYKKNRTGSYDFTIHNNEITMVYCGANNETITVNLDTFEQTGKLTHDRAIKITGSPGDATISYTDQGFIIGLLNHVNRSRGLHLLSLPLPGTTGIDMNSNTYFNDKTVTQRQMFHAIRTGNIGLVRRYLTKKVPLNTPGLNGKTPLMCAAYTDNETITRLLVDHGADLLFTNKKGISILHAACYGGQFRLIREIVKKSDKSLKELLTSTSNDGRTPLNQAVYGEQIPVMKYLLSKGADINQRSGTYGRTALHHAVMKHKNSAAKFLIEHGANVNARDTEGSTPLHFTIKGNREIAQLLLEHGADPNIATNAKQYKGLTPFHLLIDDNQIEMIRLFLKYNADLSVDIPVRGMVTSYKTEHWPLLIYTLYKGFYNKSYDPVSILLIENGININNKAKTGYFKGVPPLKLAIDRNNKKLLFTMLYKGADLKEKINTKYNGTLSLLDYAHGTGAGKHLILTTEQEKTNRLQKSLLHAIKKKDLKKVKQLITEGASPVYKYSKRSGHINAEGYFFNHQNKGGYNPHYLYYPLDFATASGSRQLVLYFLPFHIKHLQSFPYNAFNYAVSHKQNRLAKLIYTGFKKQKPSFKKPGLVTAVRNGNTEMVDFLLKEGADPKKTFINEITLLNIAMETRHPVIAYKISQLSIQDQKLKKLFSAIYTKNHTQVQKLLKEGAHTNQKALGGITPLAWASYLGNNKAVALLLKSGAKTAISHYEKHLVYCAALLNKYRTLDLLLKNGAQLECATDQWGFGPFHVAAKYGYIRTMQTLLANKASLFAYEITTNRLNTPLHVAIQYDQMKSITFLLNKGMPVNYQDAKKRVYTPLMYAIICNNHSVTRLLLKRGANADLTTNYGDTALHFAARNGNIDQFKLIMHRSTHIDYANNNNETPLSYAVQNGKYAIVSLLLQQKVNPGIKNKYGDSLLHSAVQYNQYAIAQLLLNKTDININTKNKKGLSPLYYAVKNNNVELCRLLINNGADHSIFINENGKTFSLLDIANHYQVWKMLKDKQVQAMKKTITTRKPTGK